MLPQPAAVDGDLAALIDDAKRLQIAMLPRPRTLSPRVAPRAQRESIDLTASEIRIPESTASLLEAWEPYGS
jgi:hypothetical protein